MPKNIVICCDGTASQYGKNNTNVVKLYEMIQIDNAQLNFYDPGVGTSSRAIFVPFRWMSNKISQGLGLDLHKNVEDAYLFLMNCYEEGDQIFLFGFSRGAHTVRRFADVLGKCGLLYKGSDNMVPYVLRMYDGDEEKSVVDNFRKTYTRSCPVHFMGVWDTVSALTRLIPRAKLDGILSDEIRFACHAVSVDERRLQFPPNIFSKKKIVPGQVVEEVWFAGFHSDVGGHYNENGLSNIPLKWIFKKAIAAGLRECPGASDQISTYSLDTIHESWKGAYWFVPWHAYGVLTLFTLLLLQLVTAYAGLFWNFPYRPFNMAIDFLKDNWIYTSVVIVALIPFTKKTRVIPEGSKIHSSVKERIEKINYKPKNLMHLIAAKKVEFTD